MESRIDKSWSWVPIVVLLGVFLVAETSSAGDDFLPYGSAGDLFSESGSGYPDRGRGRIRRSNDLFPQGGNHHFISFQFGERRIEGTDFDGLTRYYSDTDMYMIPNLEPAPYFGLYTEFRQGYFGGGLGYSRASHDWSWDGTSQDPAQATSHFVDFDFRFHAFPARVIQPFGQLGFSFNGIRIEDGKYNAATGGLSDISMWGWGANWGAGVDYYPSRKFKLTAGARWHADSYNEISDHSLDEGLVATGVNYYLSVGLNIGS